MELIDIIEELNACKGYQTAFLSTYTCDIDLIDQIIVPPLIDKGCNKILLFADRKMLTESLKQASKQKIGSRYIINPIKTHHAFHPKVFLLLGKDRAKLFVGSGNLTCAGMLVNIEAFAKFEYTPESETNLGLIISAFNMFSDIAERNPYPLQEKVFAAAEDYPYLVSKKPEGSQARWLDNCIEPIITQLKDIIDEEINSIDIFTPYFDAKCEALIKLNTVFKLKACRVFVKNGSSNLKLKQNDGIRYYCFNVFNQKSSFYHAKVFIFYGAKHDYVLYGSANCSTQALLLTNDLGNYEACIFEKAEKGEFDYYVDWLGEFDDIDEVDFSSIPNTPAYQYSNTYFESACLSSKVLNIELRQHSYSKIQEILINDHKTSFKQDDKSVVLRIDDHGNILGNNSVFDISVAEEDGQRYGLIGWYLDEESIIYTHEDREEIIKHKILSGQWDSDVLCVLDIINEFYSKVSWDYDELTKSADYLKNKQRETSIDNAINLNEEDYFVEDDIGKEKTRIDSKKSGSIIDIFYFLGMEKYTKTGVHKKTSQNEHAESEKREQLEAEYSNYDVKWFSNQLKRLINKYFRSLEDRNYMAEVPLDYFWEKNIAFLEFVQRLIYSEAYSYLERKNDVNLPLKTVHYIKMLDAFLTSLIKYRISEIADAELKNKIICMSIFVILVKNKFHGLLYENGWSGINRSFSDLRKLVSDDTYFREHYEDFSHCLDKQRFGDIQFFKRDLVKCFEELFDYNTVSTATEEITPMIDKPFAINDGNTVCLVIRNNDSEIINPTHMRQKMKSIIAVMKTVNVWSNKTVKVSIDSKVGKIRCYSVAYHWYLRRLDETIRYANGYELSIEIENDL